MVSSIGRKRNVLVVCSRFSSRAANRWRCAVSGKSRAYRPDCQVGRHCCITFFSRGCGPCSGEPYSGHRRSHDAYSECHRIRCERTRP
jgi:hypothetical protein